MNINLSDIESNVYLVSTHLIDWLHGTGSYFDSQQIFNQSRHSLRFVKKEVYHFVHKSHRWALA